MAVCYNKLWKILIDRNMSKTQLIKSFYKSITSSIGERLCIYRFEQLGQGVYGSVLYDNTPGGSGYVKTMNNANTLRTVLLKAYDIITAVIVVEKKATRPVIPACAITTIKNIMMKYEI